MTKIEMNQNITIGSIRQALHESNSIEVIFHLDAETFTSSIYVENRYGVRTYITPSGDTFTNDLDITKYLFNRYLTECISIQQKGEPKQ